MATGLEELMSHVNISSLCYRQADRGLMGRGATDRPGSNGAWGNRQTDRGLMGRGATDRPGSNGATDRPGSNGAWGK